jgi:uncharacterized caspase-like protein
MMVGIAVCFGVSSNAQDLKYFQDATGKYGFKDASGKVVIKAQYDDVSNFHCGMASVQINDKWGCINTSGKIVIPVSYWYISAFCENGLALVLDTTGKYGYMDATGKYVIPSKFANAEAFNDNSNGLAAVEESGAKFGFIDKTGEYVIQPQFDWALSFGANGLAAVKINGKWGYINGDAKFAIPLQFDGASRFCDNGLASVQINGKWGAINVNGKVVVQPKFDATFYFSADGVASAKLNGNNGFIDETGQFFSTKEQLLASREAKYSIKAGENYTAYMSRLVPSWESYLEERDVKTPVALTTADIKKSVESEVNAWQQKGEFESSAKWQLRVNDQTRAAKVAEVAKRIEKEYNDKVADYNAKASAYRADYEAEYRKVSDRYCSEKAKEFARQKFELKPYDADNETFLIASETAGDILLPVSVDDAPSFKSSWNALKANVVAEFVPTGNDVALKSVKFGKYVYDGNTKANYAVTSVDYNFAPIEISEIAAADYNFDQISEAPSITIASPEAKTITAKKVNPDSKKLTAGSASDVDKNIPQGKAVAKNTFAIVIANENYKNVEMVENAANDGNIMAKYLNQTVGIPEKQVFTYINATYGDMVDALDKISNIAKAYGGSDFNVIYYYAGHGVPDETSKEAYLLPVDGKPGSSSVNIPLSTLYSRLGSLGASSVYVMLDACFSGAQRGDGMLAMARGVAIKAKTAEPQGNMIVLSAAQGDETAYPYRSQSHGIFTYFLLKKLQETSGNVTFGDLSDYVIDNVRKTSVIENDGKLQTPTVRASFAVGDSWRNSRIAR